MFGIPYWDSAQRRASPTGFKAHGQKNAGTRYSDPLTQTAKYTEESGEICWRTGLLTAPVNTPCLPTSQTHCGQASGAKIKENHVKEEKEMPTAQPSSLISLLRSITLQGCGWPEPLALLQLMPGNFRASVAWGWGHRLETESLQSEFQLQHLLAVWPLG